MDDIHIDTTDNPLIPLNEVAISDYDEDLNIIDSELLSSDYDEFDTIATDNEPNETDILFE